MTVTGVCTKCQRQLPEGSGRTLCSACLVEAALVSRLAHQSLLQLGDSHALPTAGRRVGDYELLEEIARGGMGVIYRARQTSLDRIVALKMILAGQFASEAELNRFRAEAEAVARLDHPNIVPIYYVGEDDGRPYFAMKLIEGGTIAQSGLGEDGYSATGKSVLRISRSALAGDPQSAIAALVVKTARAIHFAHQHGILHRDLKPANILLDTQGEPHVTDFGLAKQLGSSLELTVSGAVLGTPNYMAPEQAAGHAREMTTAADVWSLGAILYELLAGQPPFRAATPLATMRAVLEDDPVPPGQLIRQLTSKSENRKPISEIDKDLETICLKCLEKEPARRYGSAEALADDLDRWRRHEPIHARPASLLEIGWKWARRKPTWAAFLAIAAIAPVTIIGVLLLMGARVTRERNHVQQQQQITRQNLYAADINVAWRAVANHDFNLAWTALDACRPDSQPSTDSRGFEWRWLMQRARGEGRKAAAQHLAPVNSIAWSPNGRFVASASRDGTTKLWDATEEILVRTLEEPGNPKRLKNYTDQRFQLDMPSSMWSATFSADSGTLLTGCGRALTAWDMASGRQLWTLPTNTYSVAVCSPTEPNLALVLRSYPRTMLGVLDLSQQTISTILTNGRADTVCFTPDGKMFARRDRDTRRIVLQKVPSGEEVASVVTTNIPDFYVEQMVITPDGRTLAACNLHHGPIQLYDLPSLRYSGQLTGHAGRGTALAVSPDGRWLASGNFDQTIRLWDLATRTEAQQLHGHRAAVLALAFSPDSRKLVSGGYDGTIRFWDVAPPPPSPEITNVVGAYAFSPDGHWLATQHANNVARLWELPARRLAQEWETPPFQSAVILTNGVLLAASIGTSNGPPYVRTFSFDLYSDSVGTRSTASLAFREKNGVSGQTPTAIFPPSVVTPLGTKQLSTINSPCSAIALSADGHYIVTGHKDGTVVLWDTQTGTILHRAERALFDPTSYSLPNRVDTLALSLDGRVLAAASSAPV